MEVEIAAALAWVTGDCPCGFHVLRAGLTAGDVGGLRDRVAAELMRHAAVAHAGGLPLDAGEPLVMLLAVQDIEALRFTPQPDAHRDGHGAGERSE